MVKTTLPSLSFSISPNTPTIASPWLTELLSFSVKKHGLLYPPFPSIYQGRLEKLSLVLKAQIAQQVALDIASSSPSTENPLIPSLLNTVEELRRLWTERPTPENIRAPVPAGNFGMTFNPNLSRKLGEVERFLLLVYTYILISAEGVPADAN